MVSKPYLVGIVGGSASGKTSFLRDLVARLPERSCCVVSLDNYYRSLDEQFRDENGRPNFDLPTAIHRDQLGEDMRALLRGESVTRTEYNFNQHDRQGRPITIEPANIFIMEGLFVFHYEEIRNLLDLRIFIDAPEAICKTRRLQRDLDERGYPRDHTEYHWVNHVLPAYRQYVLPYREEAHFVVTNHSDYLQGLDVVSAHLMAEIGR
jgi:uridine kinase